MVDVVTDSASNHTHPLCLNFFKGENPDTVCPMQHKAVILNKACTCTNTRWRHGNMLEAHLFVIGEVVEQGYEVFLDVLSLNNLDELLEEVATLHGRVLHSNSSFKQGSNNANVLTLFTLNFLHSPLLVGCRYIHIHVQVSHLHTHTNGCISWFNPSIHIQLTRFPPNFSTHPQLACCSPPDHGCVIAAETSEHLS